MKVFVVIKCHSRGFLGDPTVDACCLAVSTDSVPKTVNSTACLLSAGPRSHCIIHYGIRIRIRYPSPSSKGLQLVDLFTYFILI